MSPAYALFAKMLLVIAIIILIGFVLMVFLMLPMIWFHVSGINRKLSRIIEALEQQK